MMKEVDFDDGKMGSWESWTIDENGTSWESWIQGRPIIALQ